MLHLVDLRSNHKCRYEEVVSRGTTSGSGPYLQSLQEVKSSKSHRGCKPHMVEGIMCPTQWGPSNEGGESRSR